ncbi:MAG TPA: 3'(2'),5'-bisphosphate nucleotidase [Acidobacteriota bacterium]|nr:3'(2'),5'-bisphosphate nucleotidase [Acidobacteriota bacterium]
MQERVTPPNDPLGRFLVETARESCHVAESVWQESAGRAVLKEDSSPVTVADFAVQAVIARRLQMRFPEEPLVAEESPGLLRQNPELRAQVLRFVRAVEPNTEDDGLIAALERGGSEVSERCWILDPIDGTKGFMRGDQYAIALARLEQGDVTWAVLGCPRYPLGREERGPAEEHTGALFLAARERGAWLLSSRTGGTTATRIEVSPTEDPATAVLVRSVENEHTDPDGIERLLSALGGIRPVLRMDSQAKYGLVATGKADFLVRLPSADRPDYREKIWDHAAGALVVEEAGGRVTDLAGRSLDFSTGRRLEHNRGLVASNGRLHQAILESLQACFLSGS